MNSPWRRPIIALAATALVLSSSGCSLPFITADSGFTPAVSATATPGTPATGTPNERDDKDFGTIQVYEVDHNAALSPSPASDSLTASVWSDLLRVATPEFASRMLIEFTTGDAPDSYKLASVVPVAADYWTLSVNLATSNDRPELIATLIHEYAHLLTLNASQVDRSADTCATLALYLGCADPHSTIEAFNRRFWLGYGSDGPNAGNSDADKDDFVSDFAATHVVEDLAETFITFVIEPESAQEGHSMVAKKLAFLASYPEYEAIRERLRAEFAQELGWAE